MMTYYEIKQKLKNFPGLKILTLKAYGSNLNIIWSKQIKKEITVLNKKRKESICVFFYNVLNNQSIYSK